MSTARHYLAVMLRQTALTLRLNFRTPLAVTYGYLLPVVFLFAFAGIFRTSRPPLLAEIGQLLTITILGSAALGLPTALVGERERGVWRRYRLLPVSPAALVGGALVARFVIVAGAVALQLALAHVVFGTPLPTDPVAFTAALLTSTFAFLGIGLLIAALADGVPAVQALGQCVFLPMILLGGVGVPLAVLPGWAQRLAGFMPGRYAVTALQHGFEAVHGPVGLGFALTALAVVGAAATAIGLLLYRWDSAFRAGRREYLGTGIALLAWLGVGLCAAGTGRLQPTLPPGYEWREITAAQIAAITYENLPGDDELVTRLAPPLARPLASARLAAIAERLPAWVVAEADNPGAAVRRLVGLATIADLAQDPQEGEIARLVFDHLRATIPEPELRRGLAWIVLRPDDGATPTSAPALGFRREIDEDAVRNRAPLYAQKYLGRLTGQLGDR
ncbi:MAG TPA: ABC transporter permease [Opitutaceae bacterium]|nr:ABC transporter permease [Opitutaceae bacterium]